MDLPVPNTRPGWLASILLIVTLFLMYYYGGIYQLFYDFYQSQYFEASFQEFPTMVCLSMDGTQVIVTPVGMGITPTITPSLTATPLVTATPTATPTPSGLPEIIGTPAGVADEQSSKITCKEQLWGLNVRIPRFVSYMAPGSIYFELHNKGMEYQNAVISINLAGEKLSLLPSMYDDDVFMRVVEQQNIAPGSTFYGRIYFGGNQIVDKKECDTALQAAFLLNGYPMDTQVEGNLTCPETDTKKSLYRSMVENLLLPPWANTLIPAISLFVCFLYDTPSDSEKKKQKGNSMIHFWWIAFKIYGFALFVISAISLAFVRGVLLPVAENENLINAEIALSAQYVTNLLLVFFIVIGLAFTPPIVHRAWQNRVGIHKRLADSHKAIRKFLLKSMKR